MFPCSNCSYLSPPVCARHVMASSNNSSLRDPHVCLATEQPTAGVLAWKLGRLNAMGCVNGTDNIGRITLNSISYLFYVYKLYVGEYCDRVKETSWRPVRKNVVHQLQWCILCPNFVWRADRDFNLNSIASHRTASFAIWNLIYRT